MSYKHDNLLTFQHIMHIRHNACIIAFVEDGIVEQQHPLYIGKEEHFIILTLVRVESRRQTILMAIWCFQSFQYFIFIPGMMISISIKWVRALYYHCLCISFCNIHSSSRQGFHARPFGRRLHQARILTSRLLTAYLFTFISLKDSSLDTL